MDLKKRKSKVRGRNEVGIVKLRKNTKFIKSVGEDTRRQKIVRHINLVRVELLEV